jgi:GT2 family glycosyltransferase
MTAAPRVDVVVLSWNDGVLLDRAVTSALGSHHVDVRVVIVDNGSEPPVPRPVDPRVALIRNPSNRGVAPARAQGIAHTDAPIVCLLDSDARLGAACLASLVRALNAEDVAMAAPVFLGQVPEASAGRAPSIGRKLARALGLTSRYARTTRVPRASSWDVDFAIGACQVIRRAAYEAVGGLDEDIFYGPEDVDLCLRLRTANWRVVQVDTMCEHPARRRHRAPLRRSTWTHGLAVARHLWRHRGFRGSRAASSGGAR